MDKMMECARSLGRAAALGTATFATLLATGMVGSADAAQASAAIPCTLTVSTPAYSNSRVSTTAVIHCAYPTTLYLQVGLSYNGGTPVYNSQNFPSTWSASLTVSRSATPGYYQASAISILGDGEQYGTIYSNNVYIPQ